MFVYLALHMMRYAIEFFNENGHSPKILMFTSHSNQNIWNIHCHTLLAKKKKKEEKQSHESSHLLKMYVNCGHM